MKKLMVFLMLFGWILADAHAATTQFLPTPPPSVTQGSLESNEVIYWFFESQLVLENDLAVDINSAGSYPYTNKPGDFYISTGTLVRSYFIHFDPVGTPGVTAPIAIAGSFSFPNPILGIIVSDNRLNVTDSILGASGTTYPTSQFRGLEFGTGSAVDILFFNGDRDTTQISFASLTGVDQLRVITAVPIPGTVLLLGCGLIGLVGFRGRKAR